MFWIGVLFACEYFLDASVLLFVSCSVLVIMFNYYVCKGFFCFILFLLFGFWLWILLFWLIDCEFENCEIYVVLIWLLILLLIWMEFNMTDYFITFAFDFKWIIDLLLTISDNCSLNVVIIFCVVFVGFFVNWFRFQWFGFI